MSDQSGDTVARSFYWISAVALVWNLIGVASYVMQVTMSAEALAALSAAERALYENVPVWATSAYAIAVNGGVVGCLLLLFRKSLALPVLVISLAAVLVQFFHAFVMADAMTVLGPSSVVLPAVIVVIGAALVWYASDAKKKGWLR